MVWTGGARGHCHWWPTPPRWHSLRRQHRWPVAGSLAAIRANWAVSSCDTIGGRSDESHAEKLPSAPPIASSPTGFVVQSLRALRTDRAPRCRRAPRRPRRHLRVRRWSRAVRAAFGSPRRFGALGCIEAFGAVRDSYAECRAADSPCGLRRVVSVPVHDCPRRQSLPSACRAPAGRFAVFRSVRRSRPLVMCC